eukprot:6931955-Alexandrium_andersonii.AAC.1
MFAQGCARGLPPADGASRAKDSRWRGGEASLRLRPEALEVWWVSPAGVLCRTRCHRCARIAGLH